MDIVEALVALGVNQSVLSFEQKQTLDEQGLLHLPGILLRPQVDALNRRLRELVIEEGELANSELRPDPNSDRLANLINKDRLFHVVLREPRVLAAVAHVLRWDIKLSSYNYRNPKPGTGGQGLHADWGQRQAPGDYQVCNSIWMLDDFTADNGATRAVPGTHRSGKFPNEEMADCEAEHPRQQLLLGNAGDVIIFNSHTWHGGTVNRTNGSRRALFGYFTRRHQKQQVDQVKYLRLETRDRLTQAERVVLGVE